MIKVEEELTTIKGNKEEIISDVLNLFGALTNMIKANPELAIAIVDCDVESRLMQKFLIMYTNILHEVNESNENN